MKRSTTPQTPLRDVQTQDFQTGIQTQDIPTAVTRFIGCDVGKTSVVVCDSYDGRIRTVPNERAALEALVAGLDDTCLIVCEATGGYEDELLDAAVRSGQAAHRADARKVKAFIRSFGILGKTDAIDAKSDCGPTHGNAMPP